jgi:hypothetical protein
MDTYTRKEYRDARLYEAHLVEMGGIAYESVSDITPGGEPRELYKAEYPTRNLGLADRNGYLATMLPSVLDALKRADTWNITLAEALDISAAA